MSDDALVVIPLPLTETGGVTYAVARLVMEGAEPFAEAIAPIPGTPFAPPKRIALSRYGLARIRPGAALRPDLYLYEGMILPPSPASDAAPSAGAAE
ncbi:MAG: hypothetical protein ACFB6R_16650 [Alphaproteobacteria bacterium]